jgi:hypothetical protein
MQLAVPLLIMLAVLLSAWGMGALARGRPDGVRWTLASLGIVLLFTLPLAYEASLFDGNCYADDGGATPCSLGERLRQSFGRGFSFTIPPAIFWLAMFVLSSKAPRQ